MAGADWHRLFFAVALVNIFLMLLLAFQTVPATPHQPEALKAGTLHTVLKHPAFLIMCLCQALYVGAETGFSSWLPSYFERMHRFPHSAGTVFGCVVAAGGIGGAVVPWAIGALTGSLGALALIPASSFLLGVILLIFDRSFGRAHH